VNRRSTRRRRPVSWAGHFRSQHDFVERTLSRNDHLSLRAAPRARSAGPHLAIAALLVAAAVAAPPTRGTERMAGPNRDGHERPVEVSADDLAFDVDVIEAPAGEDFTIG
jgi:hypothetical protein